MRRVTILVLLGVGLSVVLAVIDTLKGTQARLITWPGDIHPIRLPHLVVVVLVGIVVLAMTRWTLQTGAPKRSPLSWASFQSSQVPSSTSVRLSCSE